VTLPDGLARFNLVVHRGRRSGREYRTPVMAFPGDDVYVIPLAFGSERDWVRNVIAAGGCTLMRRGRAIALTSPSVVELRVGLPLLPRVGTPVLRLLGVTEFLQLQRDATPGQLASK
jgi:deazaflavin-dependent oxidoreductase (nitroreductase family)